MPGYLKPSLNWLLVFVPAAAALAAAVEDEAPYQGVQLLAVYLILGIVSYLLPG